MDRIRDLLARPYFVPADTPLYSQIQFFQENQQRLGFVRTNTAKILGLITLEDIIEELIGKFTTSTPDVGDRMHWGEDGSVRWSMARPTCASSTAGSELALPRSMVRRRQRSDPRTPAGHPETGVSMKIADTPIEVVQTRTAWCAPRASSVRGSRAPTVSRAPRHEGAHLYKAGAAGNIAAVRT